MHLVTIIRTLCIYVGAAAMRTQPTRPLLDASRRAALQGLALAPIAAQASTFDDAPLVPRSLVVNCVDVPATAAFYSEALGMTVVAERRRRAGLVRPDGSGEAEGFYDRRVVF